VPSGKGTEGLFQRARLLVAPVSVWTSGAADEVVSSRLDAVVELELELVLDVGRPRRASGKEATGVASSETTVVVTSCC
jgi:hypothetical protein